MSSYIPRPKGTGKCTYQIGSKGGVPVLCNVEFPLMVRWQKVCATHSIAYGIQRQGERNKVKNEERKQTGGSANKVTNDILLQLPIAFPACRVWRRNVGAGIPYSVVKILQGILSRGSVDEARRFLQSSRPVTFGLQGEADIDGIIKLNGYGVRLVIEVKVGRDKQSPEQASYQRMVEDHGGIYVVAGSVEQAVLGVRLAVDKRPA